MAVEPFRIGRATITSGAPRNDKSGAPQIRDQGGDVVTVSGTYAPNDQQPAAQQLAQSDAFRQQWLGMAETPDRAVPVIAPARFQMNGFWFPLETSVSDISYGTDARGVLSYSGQFRRILPSWAQAGFGHLGVIGKRPTSVHVVTSAGYLWWPTPIVWDEVFSFGAAQTIQVSVEDIYNPSNFGTIKSVLFGDAVSGSNVLPSVAYATKPETHYVGSVTIERQGDDGNWYPITGRQLPPTASSDQVRISNGIVRATFLSAGRARVEAFSQVNKTWGLGGEWAIDGIGSTGAPAIVRESIEECTVRFPGFQTSTGTHAFVSFTMKRGDRWVEVGIDQSLVPAVRQIQELNNPSSVQLLGGLQSLAGTPQPWCALSAYQDVAGSNPASGILAVPGTQSQFALGSVLIDNISTPPFSFSSTVNDYWKIIAATLYPITL